MTTTEAYELGKRDGAKWNNSLRRFEAAARWGESEYPIFHGYDLTLSLFWEAGFLGLEQPRRVRAVRIGKLPVDGRSMNFREQQMEAGVSVLHLVGEDRKDNGTFDRFNGGERITVEGWLHYRRGSDGEPLLVGAVEVNQ